MNREVQNAVTGALAFGLWEFLAYRTPEHSIPISVGCLLSLVGFAGRDAIIEILKNWSGQ